MSNVCRYLAVTSDVLTSVKKMEESLRRLRTARGTSSASGSQGMSDDDKIRLQLCLDVKELRTQVGRLVTVSAFVLYLFQLIFINWFLELVISCWHYFFFFLCFMNCKLMVSS